MYNTAIDISHIPFSRYGANLALSAKPANEERTEFNELYIHHAKLRADGNTMFILKVGLGEPQNFTCEAEPDAVTIKTADGSAKFYIKDDETLIIDSDGLDLRIDARYKWIYGTEYGPDMFRFIMIPYNLQPTYKVLTGKGTILRKPDEKRIAKQDMTFECVDGKLHVCLTLSIKEPKDIPEDIDTEKDTAEIRKEWNEFAELMEDLKSVDEQTDNFTRLTWYNLWSSFVSADGIYKRDTMLMSKKNMNSVWSWDHCFNALAMARSKDKAFAKQKAFDQFMAPFVLQTEKGVLPDMWNPDCEIRWGTTKPPIHGWCFSKLMDMFEFDEEELKTVYTWLKKWTEWWTVYSDSDQDGIPDYPQGCDSGWDNSTLFDASYYVETPDLPAFLIFQMNTLSRIAKELKDEENAKYWADEAKAMLDRLIEHSWNGERFVGKISISHEHEENPTSLLSMMPLVLGDMLPKEISDKLVAVLERDFLTENGLATEMPTSQHYNPDGYWRGPIWAPSTYLLVDGLRKGGYTDLAETVAKRYCDMSCIKAKGNYENFDALTGKGWRAPGYTWSASVYMLLRGEYDKK